MKNNPMRNIGIPLKWGKGKWYQRNYIKRVKKLALKCAIHSGKQHHIIPFEHGCMIVNSTWKDKYNKKVPRAGRINMMKVRDQAYYSTPSDIKVIR